MTSQKRSGSPDLPIDFSRSPYWRSYPLNTVSQRAAPALQRGFRDLLWNEVGTYHPDSGVLVEASTKARALEMVVAGLGAHQDERDTLFGYLRELIEVGFLAWKKRKKRFTLWIPSFVPAQKAVRPGTQRVRAHRAKKGGKELAKHLGQHAQPGGIKEQTALPLHPVEGVTGNVTGNVNGNVTENGIYIEIDPSIEREIDLQSLAQGWLKHPLEHGSPREWPEVHAVVSHFNQLFEQRGEPRNDRDPALRCIVARMAEGFTLRQLLEAVTGARANSWVQKTLNVHRITHVLGDTDKVEAYRRELAPPSFAAGRPPKRVQPSADAGYGDWDEAEAEAASGRETPLRALPKAEAG